MTKLLVNNVYTQIEELSDLNIIDKISDKLSYSEPGYKFTFKYKVGQWDGRRRLLTKTLKFPTGLANAVEKILVANGIVPEIINNIQYEPGSPLNYLGPKLYDHQIRMTELALEYKRGMIQSCTGSGKSLAIANIVCALNLPTMVYVVSHELLEQMQQTLASAINEEIGIIGGGKCEIKKINVCSVWTGCLACGNEIQNLDDDSEEKWTLSERQKKEILGAIREAKVCILDEAHFAAATSIRTIFKESKSAAYKLGFSGTAWRSDGCDLLLEAAFGQQICKISATELIEKGLLAPPKIFFRDIPKYQSFIQKKWSDVRSKYLNDNDVRDAILINNTVKLLEMGRKPLLLFKDLKHGEKLYSMIPDNIRTELITGNTSTTIRSGVRERYLAGKIELLMGSSIYDTGFDIPSLDALVLCSAGRSTNRALQKIGRIIRSYPKKTDAIVVDTYDSAHYLKDHSLARYQIYISEPGFSVKVGPQMHKFLSKRGVL